VAENVRSWPVRQTDRRPRFHRRFNIASAARTTGMQCGWTPRSRRLAGVQGRCEPRVCDPPHTTLRNLTRSCTLISVPRTCSWVYGWQRCAAPSTQIACLPGKGTLAVHACESRLMHLTAPGAREAPCRPLFPCPFGASTLFRSAPRKGGHTLCCLITLRRRVCKESGFIVACGRVSRYREASSTVQRHGEQSSA
jgi:hypothetical protein